jgi:glycosyltransferase involved in cell wall biosynthesis
MPLPAPPRRVLVLITEDWFAVSHFLPLLRALIGLGLDVTVATRCAGKEHLIAATGAYVVPLDFKRGAFRPRGDIAIVARLHRLIRRVRPDAIHAIAMKPIALGALAAATGTGTPLVIHLTGVGLTGTETSASSRVLHDTVMALIGHKLRRADVRVLVENPDDRDRFAQQGEVPCDRIILLGGAGLDPDAYVTQPMPAAPPVRIAYVGRMLWTKGVDVLMDAHRLIHAQGLRVSLELCGAPDPENPRSFGQHTLESWAAQPGVAWRGFVSDIAGVWRNSHLAIVPSRGGEGLPKALLEAAACGRGAIVTDVPGCRHFVRDDVEGLIVPPDDAEALASAIARLAGDPELRERMGMAARQRFVGGFTERHLQVAVQKVYRELLGLPVAT